MCSQEPATVPILRQMSLIHNPHSLFKLHIIVSHLRLGLPSCLSSLQNKTLQNKTLNIKAQQN
jgi:hypothetical protein